MFSMLSKELYNIGKQYNKVTKYNIDYDKNALLNYICATHINELLNSNYELNSEQTNKLNAILNNLIIL